MTYPADVRAALFTMGEDLRAANEVNVDEPNVVAGLAFLEQIGILAAGRAALIRA